MGTVSRKLLILLVILFALVIFPRPASAELVTGKDWIGIFAVGSSDVRPAGGAWQYVNCSQTSGEPFLERGSGSPCNLTTPIGVGAYEARMFANDSCLFEGTSNCTRLSTSNVGWRAFSPNSPSTGCSGPNISYIDLSWPSLAGVNRIDVYRNSSFLTTLSASSATTAYRDTSTLSGTSYYYSLAAFDARGTSSFPTANTSSIITASCAPPQVSSLTITSESTSQAFSSSTKASGRQSSQAGKNWYNPATFQLLGSSGTGTTTFYLAVYSTALGLSTSFNSLNSIANSITSDPGNGVLLAYNTSGNYYVWNPSTSGWVNITGNSLGFKVCSNGDCNNQLRYIVQPGNNSNIATPNTWRVRWDQSFGTKNTYTAGFAQDSQGFTDFKADITPNLP